MSAYDDIIKMVQQSKMLPKTSGGELQQFRDITHNQKLWKQNLSGFNMFTELGKTLEQNLVTNRFHSTQLGVLDNAIFTQSKFDIPKSTLAKISSISEQHNLLFRDIGKLLTNQRFSQLSSLHYALANVSGELAAKASTKNRWNLIDDFEEITSSAFAIKEKIINDEGITKASLQEFKSFLERIEIKVDKIDHDASLIIWKIITILCFILTIVSEVRNWLPKPNYATKEEVENVIKDQFTTLEQNLTKKEYRTTNRACKVLLKPKTKTVTLATLPTGFNVIILQANRKWIYVSFISPKDNLPSSGWILKKYLSSSK